MMTKSCTEMDVHPSLCRLPLYVGHKALSDEITTQAQPHHTTTGFNGGTRPAALVPYDTSYGLPHRIASVVSWWCWGKVSSPTTHAMPLPCAAVSQTGTECDLSRAP